MLRWIVLRYDRHLWQFSEALGAALTRADIHQVPDPPKLYEAWEDARLDETWAMFVGTQLVPKLGRIAYQVRPTLRVQRPGECPAYGVHRDTELGHSPASIVCWVPLSGVGLTNGITVDRERPPIKEAGQMLLFNGALAHGPGVSMETFTRVSFDARLVQWDYYTDLGEKTVQTGTPIRLGDYFADSADIDLIGAK